MGGQLHTLTLNIAVSTKMNEPVWKSTKYNKHTYEKIEKVNAHRGQIQSLWQILQSVHVLECLTVDLIDPA